MAIQPEKLQTLVQLMGLLGDPMQELGGLVNMQSALEQQNLNRQSSKNQVEQLQMEKLKAERAEEEAKFNRKAVVADFNEKRRQFQETQRQDKRKTAINLNRDRAAHELNQQKLQNDERVQEFELDPKSQMLRQILAFGQAGMLPEARRVGQALLKLEGLIKEDNEDEEPGGVGSPGARKETILDYINQRPGSTASSGADTLGLF